MKRVMSMLLALVLVLLPSPLVRADEEVETGCLHPDESVTPATCVSPAHCNACGQDFGEIDPDAHPGDQMTSATCVSRAYCEACQQYFGEINPDAHPEEEVIWATCVSPAHCDACNEDFGEIDHTDGHLWGEPEYVEPTCVSRAYWLFVCQRDHSHTVIEVEEESDFDENNHDWSPWELTADGTGHTRSCQRGGCGATETFDHVFDEATCTEKARCTVCGAEYGEPLGHSFTNYVSNNDATCTADGTKTATCDRVDCTVTDTVADEGSQLGHAWGAWIPAADGTGHSRTCQRQGCDATETATHSGGQATYTEKAKCTACGAEYGELLVPETYTIQFKNENGTVLQSGEVVHGEMPVYTGTTPTKAEDAQYTYTFAGWTPELAAATGDATYRAHYTATAKPAEPDPVYFTVSFNLNGHGSNVPAAQRVEAGKFASIPAAPANDGDFTFVRWSLYPDGGSFQFDNTPVTANIILFAIWTESVPEGDVDEENNISHPGDMIQHSADTNYSGAMINTALQRVESPKSWYHPHLNGFDYGSDGERSKDDTTYNFGFFGSNPISITLSNAAEGAEGTKALFKGNNQYYAPSGQAAQNAPAETGVIGGVTPVEFAASNSLFPFSQEYGKGTFVAGDQSNELENTLPAGKTATFTEGFTLGANHTLVVQGTLIG